MKQIIIGIFFFLISNQLHSQNSSLRIGFGMHQDIHYGINHVIDSILIEPYSIKDAGPTHEEIVKCVCY